MKNKILLLTLFLSNFIFGQEGIMIADTIGMSQSQKEQFINNLEDPDQITNCLSLTVGNSEDFKRMEKLIRQSKSQFDLSETIRIPVVYHVYHITKYGFGGVPEEVGLMSKYQVWSALDNKIEGYKAYKGTRSETGFDTNIEFYLANIDEEGNYFDGIIYHDMDESELFTLEQKIQAYNQGFFGSGLNFDEYMSTTNLDVTKYLNIHLVWSISDNDGGSGIQGLAFLPINEFLPPYFGQTNLDNVTGRPSVGYYDLDFDGVYDDNDSVYYNLKASALDNDTHPHETGHNFGLYHTQQGSSCAPEEDCTNEGDLVCDTEPTVTNFGCGSICSDPTPVSDVNYMGYSSCRYEFTEGQNERMRGFLNTILLPLKNSISDGYAYRPRRTTVDIFPIEETEVQCEDGSFMRFIVKNTGDSILTNLSVAYGNSYDNDVDSSYTMNLGPGQYKTIHLGNIPGQTKNRYIKVLSVNNFPVNEPIQSVQTNVGNIEILVESQSHCSGDQNYWQIIDLDSQETIHESEPYSSDLNSGVRIDKVCLEGGGNFQFILHDTAQNGWSGFCNPDFFSSPYMKVFVNGNLCNEIYDDEFVGSAWTFTQCGSTNLSEIQESEEIIYYNVMYERVEFDDIPERALHFKHTLINGKVVDKQGLIKQ